MNDQFEQERKNNKQKMANDLEFKEINTAWFNKSTEYKYSYNFNWLGRPIIQYPQDMFAVQELIWKIKPDLIIETGIAHGGSLIFYASILELLGGDGKVLGIDIEIREHNRIEIEKHSLFKRITMLEGSSIDKDIVEQAKEFASGKERIMVILDSNHTHEHVLAELEAYSPLVTNGSYLVVFDTVVENMNVGSFTNRPWGKGNNPKTAVDTFLETNQRFVIDKDIENTLMITVSPGGYLKCIRD